jgi:transcriptional activator protein UGA3
MRNFARSSTEYPSLTHRSELLGLLDFNISLEVTATLGHVAEIPSTEIADSTLIFPLFLAGGEATEAGEVKFVRQRLQLMFEKRHFQNISRALSLLKEVWDRRLRRLDTPDSDDSDWQKILASQSCRLLLT